MKKLLFILSVILGLSFISCSDDDQEYPKVPYLIVTGLDANQTAVLSDPMTLKINVLAEGKIGSVICSVESSSLVPWLLDEKGFGSSFDLTNPSVKEAEFLNSLGIANGSALLGSEDAVIDFSSALPKLFNIADDNIDHKFKLVITDLYGQQFYFTFTIKQYKK